MKRIRSALNRLGWPTVGLSDEEIVGELCERWFAGKGNSELVEGFCGRAVAHGIFECMSGEGNLDALCWSEDQEAPSGLSELDLDLTTPPEEVQDRCPEEDRRTDTRHPVSELIRFNCEQNVSQASGWAIDVSEGGVAFIAQTEDAPAVGSQIESEIYDRRGRQTELGSCVVVRTELLTDHMALVCAQRIASRRQSHGQI